MLNEGICYELQVAFTSFGRFTFSIDKGQRLENLDQLSEQKKMCIRKKNFKGYKVLYRIIQGSS